MSIFTGFFDAAFDETAQEYDRLYDASDFTAYFEALVGSGVCVYGNEDSMRVFVDAAARRAVVNPGYLFIRGHWLKNDGLYTLNLSGLAAGTYAVCAQLNAGRRDIALTLTPRTDPEEYPDALVLAYLTVDENNACTVADKRGDAQLCGWIDAAGSLSDKVSFAVDYIERQIEAKLDRIEQDLTAKSAEIDAKIAQADAVIAKIAPPAVGTVKFSASSAVEDGWLACNGDFISEATYPELVAALGKLTPGVSEFQEIAAGRIPRDISNGVIADGRLWIFSYSAKTLYGLSLQSPHDVTEIAVTGADLLYDPAQEPIYLSLIEGRYLFLSQRNGLAEVYVYKTYVRLVPLQV